MKQRSSCCDEEFADSVERSLRRTLPSYRSSETSARKGKSLVDFQAVCFASYPVCQKDLKVTENRKGNSKLPTQPTIFRGLRKIYFKKVFSSLPNPLTLREIHSFCLKYVHDFFGPFPHYTQPVMQVLGVSFISDKYNLCIYFMQASSEPLLTMCRTVWIRQLLYNGCG